jgi:DNA-binding beta-propeller fold protein YncE
LTHLPLTLTIQALLIYKELAVLLHYTSLTIRLLVLLLSTALLVMAPAIATLPVSAQRTLPPLNKLSTLAGAAGQRGNLDGPGADARFAEPSDVAISPDGSYALLVDAGNDTIRRIAIASAQVTTLATVPGAQALAISPDGSYALVVSAAEHVVLRLDLPSGRLTLVAGKFGERGSYDGPGLTARFSRPYDVAISADNSFALIADADNRTIRRLDLRTSEVLTIAGRVGQRGFDDGPGDEATFSTPLGLAISPDNSFALVADGFLVRRIDLVEGSVATLAGQGGSAGYADGPLSDARFFSAHGISLSNDGTFALLSDSQAHTIRRLDLLGEQVTTLVGLGGEAGSLDGLGSAARLRAPAGLALGPDGSYALVVDSANHTLRLLITPIEEASIGTLAGRPGVTGTTDGFGAAALFNRPVGVSSSDNGFVAIADSQNHTIRLANLRTGQVDTLAGQAGLPGSTDGLTRTARFNRPLGVSISRDGNRVLVADTNNATIRLIDIPTGTVSTLAGTAGAVGTVDGTGANARFNQPFDLELSADSRFALVADTENHAIRRLDLASGQVITLAGVAGVPGNSDGSATAARFNRPVGISMSRDTSFALIAEDGNGAIRRLDLASGEVTTMISGLPTRLSQTSLAQFGDVPVLNVVVPCTPGLALVSNAQQHIVEQFDLGNRLLQPLVGKRNVSGAVDGYGEAARFNRPTSLGASCYNNGTVVVGDTDNQLIREINPLPDYRLLLPFVIESKL